MIGVTVVVGAMIATLYVLQNDQPSTGTVDTTVPGLGGPGAAGATADSGGRAVGHRVGDVAPAFALPTLAGEPVALSDYRGRLVILDFWASWCVPCRLSMPSLAAMADDLGEDVVLVGVSLDRSEVDARSYVDTRDYTNLIALYGSLSAARAVADDYGVRGIPRTFVIDREGIVRFAGHPNLLKRDLIEAFL